MAKTIPAKLLIMSSPGTRVLLVLASLVIVIAGLKAASTIIVPLLMALFIAIITTPLMMWLTDKSVPKWAALSLILLVLATFILTVGSLISSSVDQFSALLPAYENKLRTTITLLSDWASRHQLTEFTGAEFTVVDPKATAKIIATDPSRTPNFRLLKRPFIKAIVVKLSSYFKDRSRIYRK